MTPLARTPGVHVLGRELITGLVLAGGRGNRMGGTDKGLVSFQGTTLAARAVQRLSPQVASILISANRHVNDYAQLANVVSDLPLKAVSYSTPHKALHRAPNGPFKDAPEDVPAFDGPLAGILAGLRAAQTPYLACVPCDCPFFPDDLVARLSAPFADPACMLSIAYAPDPEVGTGTGGDPHHRDHPHTLRAHPVFALMRIELADSLAEQLAAGERRLLAWCTRHNAFAVRFDDMHAFYNVNTLQALDEAQATPPGLSIPR